MSSLRNTASYLSKASVREFLAFIQTMAFLLMTFGVVEISSLELKAQTADEQEGQSLASDLRNATPEKGSEIRGVLKIRSSKQKITNNIPVICSIVPGEKSWAAIYETAQMPNRGAERMIVRHFPGRPNEYYYARAEGPTAPLPAIKPLTAEEANIPLAGSDFWLTDLGLDFLHWPQQRRIRDAKNAMRLGRSCYILESVNPNGKKIARVKSWIDRESADSGAPGILVAEAYDADGKRVKEFTLSGSSFKKVDGQWQLEKMTIESIPTKSRTILEFDLSKPPSP